MKQLFLFGIIALLFSCKKDSDTSSNEDGTTTNDFSSLHSKIYNVTSVTTDGDYLVVKTTSIPDHKSPFFGKSHAKYEAYNGNNPSFSTTINLGGTISDPNISVQNVTFRIPKNPKKATTHSATGGGPIGFGINGVCIFNQYNGMGALLDALEINNADQYHGHPTPEPSQQYHYHYEPLYLTKTYGKNSCVGFLSDGFPIYGPEENGKTITNSDLDNYHGHVSSTIDFPNDKIYHYHVTGSTSSTSASLISAAPWINGDGYYGTKGTVTQ